MCAHLHKYCSLVYITVWCVLILAGEHVMIVSFQLDVVNMYGNDTCILGQRAGGNYHIDYQLGSYRVLGFVVFSIMRRPIMHPKDRMLFWFVPFAPQPFT